MVFKYYNMIEFLQYFNREKVGGNSTKSTKEIVFSATLPPMGYATFTLVAKASPRIDNGALKEDFIIENEYTRLVFEPDTRRLSLIMDKISKLR